MKPIASCAMKSHIANLPGEKPNVRLLYSVWPMSSIVGATAALMLASPASLAHLAQLPDERGRDDRADHEPQERTQPARLASLPRDEVVGGLGFHVRRVVVQRGVFHSRMRVPPLLSQFTRAVPGPRTTCTRRRRRSRGRARGCRR